MFGLSFWSVFDRAQKRSFAMASSPIELKSSTGSMIFIPGRTFRTDKHYPEEAPAYPVTVHDFWIDRAPVKHASDAQKACCVPENPRGDPVEASYDPCLPAARIPRSKACARRITAAATARPRAMRSQWIGHVGFRCVMRGGSV